MALVPFLSLPPLYASFALALHSLTSRLWLVKFAFTPSAQAKRRQWIWRTGATPARAAALALVMGSSAAAAQAADRLDCGADAPCVVEGGVYRVRPPAGWDRRARLPALVFFHGWGQSAADVMQDEAIARATSDLGLLLIAPEGVEHSWSFPGSPERHRHEFAFVKAVLDDAETRFPIDRRRLWASGFS
jgi:polyhydroxybutyrate depolymerase